MFHFWLVLEQGYKEVTLVFLQTAAIEAYKIILVWNKTGVSKLSVWWCTIVYKHGLNNVFALEILLENLLAHVNEWTICISILTLGG